MSDAEVLQNIANGGSASDGPLDTFDAPISRTPEQVQAELQKMNPAKKDDTHKEPEIKKVTQTEKLDEEEVKEPVAEKEAVEEKAEDKLPEPEIEEKPDYKAIRAKYNDMNIDIPEDATVKVTIKGKSDFVSVKELRDNFSGKQVWGEKIQEVTRKEKAADQFYEKVKAEKGELASHINKITTLLDDPQKDPLEALLYLVDLSGRNVHDYTKRVYDTLGKTVLDLDGMDQVERELYWKNRELSYLRSNQAAKDTAAKSVQTQREYANRINHLRESQGVSEEQYVQAHEDLGRLGYSREQITPEAITRYAAYKPHLDKADEICGSYEDDLSSTEMEQLIDVVAETLKRNPKIDDRKAIEIAAYQLGWGVETDETLIAQLENKNKLANSVRPKANPTRTKKQTDRPESFSDFDEQYYGR